MLKLCYNGIRGTLSLDLKSVRLFSTSAEIGDAHVLVDYLVKSLGFSREEAIHTSAKVSHLKSIKNYESIISFFRKGVLDKTQIRNIICSVPSLLTCNVDKTLKPKIRVLQDLGLSGSDLVDFVVSNPGFITRGLESHILPLVDFLKSILGSNENVAKAIKKSSWLLSGTSCEKLQENVALLQNYGLSSERIQKFILRNPRCLTYNYKWLEGSLVRVEKMLGIPRESAMFEHGFQVIASFSMENLQSKYELFKSHGWSESEVREMVRKQPGVLRLSMDTIPNRLNFFMKDLGYEARYIASHPSILLFSMEKRVLPRNSVLRILKDRKLIMNQRLYGALCQSESQFLNQFVLPHKDELPQLYEAYINGRMDSFMMVTGYGF
ncbi:hypothetical protein Nepgr_024486 [Nepenthes gracilis]|uniref:Uncharacterized protein n=1 Tax=Nepenthes gracilis TaxID=150966 RepID=A0AAD3T498_NEPGR|nr:hypothetical protein Nepgr_024486 [Nepenthes gracilis]